MATFPTENYPDLTDTTAVAVADAASQTAFHFMQVFKIIIGVIGLIGNLTVCIAVVQMKSEEVKFLIGSQDAIDLLTSCVLLISVFTSRFTYTQFATPDSWILGLIFCATWHFDTALFSFMCMSTYNLMAIAIERYVTVIHPMWYRANFTRRKACILGLVLWLIAPTMQLTFSIGQTHYIDRVCDWRGFRQIDIAIAGTLLFIWEFFGPCIIMGYCFTKIILELRDQDKRAKKLQADYETACSGAAVSVKKSENDVATAVARKSRSRSRNVTKTFIIVYIVFILCWSSNQVLFLQKSLGGYRHHGQLENYFADGMAILNSAINPFIFVFRFKQYREKMKLILCFKYM